MTKIDRWMAAFEAMDDRARDELLRLAEVAALAHPRQSAARTHTRQQEAQLSLVASNMIVVRPAQRLSQAEHVSAPTLVRAVK